MLLGAGFVGFGTPVDGFGALGDGFTGNVPSCAGCGIGGRTPGSSGARPVTTAWEAVRQVVQVAPLRVKALGPALPPVWLAW